MGFGHRVYKNYDPRAAIVKQTADSVLDKLGGNNQLLDLARQLEEIALSDDYFIERKLYPNVDFYTGLIYRAMGFPTRMFTVLFALGRLPGWIAQWREMIADPTHQDRPSPPALHRPHRARVRRARRPLTGPRVSEPSGEEVIVLPPLPLATGDSSSPAATGAPPTPGAGQIGPRRCVDPARRPHRGRRGAPRGARRAARRLVGARQPRWTVSRRPVHRSGDIAGNHPHPQG